MLPLFEPGSVFARDFRIVRPLSQGGMGAVYVVEQLSTGTERALKVMHGALVAEPRLRARFVQEARIGSRVESDHVVQVVAAGVDEASGTPFLAMELLRGETLAEHVARSGPLSAELARHVFGQLGHALAAAHDAQIVHRDLKPENLFLAAARRADVPFTLKVLDFGIARLVAESTTKATAAIGTPMWMAPEQAEANLSVSPATDVWAVGLIAFQLLTGRVYWLAAAGPNPSTVALMKELLFEPLTPASTRAAALGVHGALPAGFDEWFGRCVCRDPAGRFPHAREAFAALERVLGGAAIPPTNLVAPTLAVRPPNALMTGQGQSPGGVPAVPPTAPMAVAATQAPGRRSSSMALRLTLGALVVGGGLLAWLLATRTTSGRDSSGAASTEKTATTKVDRVAVTFSIDPAKAKVTLTDVDDDRVVRDEEPLDGETVELEGGKTYRLTATAPGLHYSERRKLGESGTLAWNVVMTAPTATLSPAPPTPIATIDGLEPAAPPAEPTPPPAPEPLAAPTEPPGPNGTLFVNALPKANCTVDGAAKGSTPITIPAAAGRHVVTCVAKDGDEILKKTASVVVPAGGKGTLALKLRE